MQETENNNNIGTKAPRTIIRVGNRALAFAVADERQDTKVAFEPYIVKSGVSKAANLRQAFKTSQILLAKSNRAMVTVDTKTMIVPASEFDKTQKEVLYSHCFTSTEGETVMACMLPDFDAVAIFGMNSDLKLVVDDHFSDTRFVPLMMPVWTYLYNRSQAGGKRKLYGYFHDGRLDVVSFDKSRLKFSNQFDAQYSRDAAYFMLYAWRQLGMDAVDDEMFLCGDIPDREWLLEAMRNYVQKVFVVNVAADFNRSPITRMPGMPLDMMLMYL